MSVIVLTLVFSPLMFLFLLFLFSVIPVLVVFPPAAAVPITALLAVVLTYSAARRASKRNKAKGELAEVKKELAALLNTPESVRNDNFETEVQLLTAKIKALE
ncbi:MAG: hypothetical protein OXM87_11860 [Truepera sp.]|nr:hypothetical protein [Truepera sp.]